MKRITVFIISGLFLTVSACKNGSKINGGQEKEMKTSTDSLSYALGINVAQNMMRSGVDTINADLFADAMSAILADDSTRIPKQDAQKIIQAFLSKQRKAQQKEKAAVGQKNLKKGQAFLEKNKRKEGIKTTESGLQYKVLKEGSGPKPTSNDKVRVHYTGTFINGEVFDSSRKRGQPIEVAVKTGRGGVIKGWVEALKMMKEGAKWKVFLPPDLAYGKRGGRGMEPNKTLIFEMELLEVLEGKAGQGQQQQGGRN